MLIAFSIFLAQAGQSIPATCQLFENWASRDKVEDLLSSSPLSDELQQSSPDDDEAAEELQQPDEVPAAVMLEILGLEQLAPAA
ncbi:hypothetical protein VCR12J2_1020042 [Vibrio coralliirubri]|nr:hypothetical protein VCR12J2_1020042 [Vibrio coralliirubri]